MNELSYLFDCNIILVNYKTKFECSWGKRDWEERMGRRKSERDEER